MGYAVEREDLIAKRNEAVARAEAKGMTVVLSEPGKILLDVDSPYQPSLDELKRKLENCPDLELIESWESKSGNLHAVVKCPKWWAFSIRSATATLLGSDPVREKMNMLAVTTHAFDEPAMLLRPGKDPDLSVNMAVFKANEVVTSICNYYGTLVTRRLSDGRMYVCLENWDGFGHWGPISEELAAHMHELKGLPMVDPNGLSDGPPSPSEEDG